MTDHPSVAEPWTFSSLRRNNFFQSKTNSHESIISNLNAMLHPTIRELTAGRRVMEALDHICDCTRPIPVVTNCFSSTIHAKRLHAAGLPPTASGHRSDNFAIIPVSSVETECRFSLHYAQAGAQATAGKMFIIHMAY